MSKLFIWILVSVFLTIHIESLFLLLQLNGRKMEHWFGKNAFTVHASVTSFLWIVTFILIVLFQLQEHIIFHHSIFLRYTGIFLMIIGAVLAIRAFSIFGLKRTLCINFYRRDIEVIKSSLYKYINNPMDYGLWAFLVGFAFFSRSLQNLLIAGVFIVVMIPHIMIENIPIRDKKEEGSFNEV